VDRDAALESEHIDYPQGWDPAPWDFGKDQHGTLPTHYVRSIAMQNEPHLQAPREYASGDRWSKFKEDIKANGITNPIMIMVNDPEDPSYKRGERINIEGHRRLLAAHELGMPEVPVHVRYFGHTHAMGRDLFAEVGRKTASSSDFERRTVRLTDLIARKADMEEVFSSGRRSEDSSQPIWVKARSDTPGLYEVADGHHRIADAIRNGRDTIEADIDSMPDDEPLEPPFYDFSQHVKTAQDEGAGAGATQQSQVFTQGASSCSTCGGLATCQTCQGSGCETCSGSGQCNHCLGWGYLVNDRPPSTFHRHRKRKRKRRHAADKPLTERTPAEIDNELFPIEGERLRHLDRAVQYKQQIDQGRTSYQKAYDEATAAHRDAQERARPFHEEFNRRGGWNRHFVVTNADGHIHRTTSCPTLHPTTQIAWLPDYSGLREKEVVDKAGYSACTVCFPSAPTNTSWLKGKEEADKADLEKRTGQCSASGTYHTDVPKDYFRFVVKPRVKCPSCGGSVTLTDTGKIRSHKSGAGRMASNCEASEQEVDRSIQKKGWNPEYDSMAKCHACGKRVYFKTHRAPRMTVDEPLAPIHSVTLEKHTPPKPKTAAVKTADEDECPYCGDDADGQGVCQGCGRDISEEIDAYQGGGRYGPPFEHLGTVEYEASADEKHDAKVIEVRDPLLGKRFSIDCSWCGVIGRWKDRPSAERALDKHPSKTASAETTASDTRTQRLQDASDSDQVFGPDASKVVHTFDDGWTIRQLQTGLDQHREGCLMHHCWRSTENGQELWPHWLLNDPAGHQEKFDRARKRLDHPLDRGAGEKRLYSLRDPDNLPHASFFHDVPTRSMGFDRPAVTSAVFGQHDDPPKPKHLERIRQWHQTLPYPVHEGRWFDGRKEHAAGVVIAAWKPRVFVPAGALPDDVQEHEMSTQTECTRCGQKFDQDSGRSKAAWHAEREHGEKVEHDGWGSPEWPKEGGPFRYVPKPSEVYGHTLRGKGIRHDDSRIPDTVYHVTTQADAVERSGMLKASGGDRGLGGPDQDRIVSMTTSRDTANRIAEDLHWTSTLAHKVGPDPSVGHRTPERKNLILDHLVGQSKREGWDYSATADWLRGGHSTDSYGLGDHLSQYMSTRESKAGIQNPVILGGGQFHKIRPERIGIVHIPKHNLDNGAQITNFDLDRQGHGLSEIRSYGDVPIAGGKVERVHQPKAVAAGVDEPMPTGGMFGPGQETLDARLFDGEHFRPEVRQGIMDRLDAFWSPRYDGWREWARVYVAGSGASYWWDSDRDLDVLIGVDPAKFQRDNPKYENLDETQIADMLDVELKGDLDPTTTDFRGMELTFYVNPASYDITVIHPYAAYDLTHDAWAVRPWRPPTSWGPQWFPERFWDEARRENERCRALLEAGDAAAITAEFDRLHELRRGAYKFWGGGFLDYGNFLWQALSAWGTLHDMYVVKHPELEKIAAVSPAECDRCDAPLPDHVMGGGTCSSCGAFQPIVGNGVHLVPKVLRKWMRENHHHGAVDLTDHLRYPVDEHLAPDLMHATWGTSTPAMQSFQVAAHPDAKPVWVEAAVLHEIGHSLYRRRGDTYHDETEDRYEEERGAHEQGRALADSLGIPWTQDHEFASSAAHGSYDVDRHYSPEEKARRQQEWDRRFGAKEMETSWHLTDNPKFKLDPDKNPENNTTLGGDWPHKGLFVSKNPETWFNGYDYVRPFAAEIEHPTTKSFGGYGGEGFLPAEDFSRSKVKRVIPIDEYAREEFHAPGWIESHHGTDVHGNPVSERDHLPKDYRYQGPDVRDMSRDEVNTHLRRANEYIEQARPHMLECQDCPYPKSEHHEGGNAWARSEGLSKHPFRGFGGFYKMTAREPGIHNGGPPIVETTRGGTGWQARDCTKCDKCGAHIAFHKSDKTGKWYPLTVHHIVKTEIGGEPWRSVSPWEPHFKECDKIRQRRDDENEQQNAGEEARQQAIEMWRLRDEHDSGDHMEQAHPGCVFCEKGVPPLHPGVHYSGAQGDLPEGLTLEYNFPNAMGFHEVVARLPGGQYAGHLQWPQEVPPKINFVKVREDMRRRGVATELLRKAREIEPNLQHNDVDLTDDGKAWSTRVGSRPQQFRVGQHVHYAGDLYRVGEDGLELVDTAHEPEEVRPLLLWDEVVHSEIHPAPVEPGRTAAADPDHPRYQWHEQPRLARGPGNLYYYGPVTIKKEVTESVGVRWGNQTSWSYRRRNSGPGERWRSAPFDATHQSRPTIGLRALTRHLDQYIDVDPPKQAAAGPWPSDLPMGAIPEEAMGRLQTHMQKHGVDYEGMVRNLMGIYGRATPENIEAGHNWYAHDAGEAVDHVMANGHTRHQAAGALAVMSPQNPWDAVDKDTGEHHGNKPEVMHYSDALAGMQREGVVHVTAADIDHADGLAFRRSGFGVFDKKGNPVTAPRKRGRQIVQEPVVHTGGNLKSQRSIEKKYGPGAHYDMENPVKRQTHGLVLGDHPLDSVASEDIAHMKAFHAHPAIKTRAKAIDILLGRKQPEEVLGKAPKTNAFRENIEFPETSDRATIDVHAASAAIGRTLKQNSPVFLGGPSTKEHGNLMYHLIETAYRDTSRRLGLERPHHAQATIWHQWRDETEGKMSEYHAPKVAALLHPSTKRHLIQVGQGEGLKAHMPKAHPGEDVSLEGHVKAHMTRKEVVYQTQTSHGPVYVQDYWVDDPARHRREFDPSFDEQRWGIICQNHGTIVSHTSLDQAKKFARDPDSWCEHEAIEHDRTYGEPPTMASAIASFLGQDPLTSTPDGAYERDLEVARAFSDHARLMGLEANVIRLAGAALDQPQAHPSWRSIEPANRHHYAVEIDGRIVDWAARQFDPTAPLPAVHSSIEESGWSQKSPV
jgi:hypothetical protein